MAYSVIGIFLNINENKTNPKYTEFITKLVNLSDLDLEPFIYLYNVILPFNTNTQLKEGIENYKTIIDYFHSQKLVKRDRTMSVK